MRQHVARVRLSALAASETIKYERAPDEDMSRSAVLRYYRESAFDYNLIWATGRTSAMHFGYYDSKARTHRAAVENMIAVVAHEAHAKPGTHVLDAGCGVGGTSLWLAQRGVSVTGINISKRQLEIARRRTRDLDVELLERDFTDTKLPDASFDAIIFLESGCYAQDKRSIIAESMRLLKEGGRLVVADGFLSEPGDHPDVTRWLDGWAVPNLASVEEFSTALEDTGFEQVRYRDVTEQVMPSSVRMHRAAAVLYVPGVLLRLVGLRSAVQMGNQRSAYYQYPTLKQGLWQYGLFRAVKPSAA